MNIYCISDDPMGESEYANEISKGTLDKKRTLLDLEKCLHFFIAGHSTMEWIHFDIGDYQMRGDVASHIVRHTKGHPRFVVQSKRPDWNKGEPRPSSESLRYFAMQVTPLSLMYMAHQRLCKRAMKETREWMLRLKQEMWKWESCDDNEDYWRSKNCAVRATSLIMVPDCVAQCGCPYGKNTCGHFTKFLDKYGDDFDQIDIRYKNYQTFLEEECK